MLWEQGLKAKPSRLYHLFLPWPARRQIPTGKSPKTLISDCKWQVRNCYTDKLGKWAAQVGQKQGSISHADMTKLQPANNLNR